MTVVWRPQAMEDRVAIYDYIEQKSPQNAAAVDEAFLEAVELIGKFPHLGRGGRRKDVREWVVTSIGFIVFYRIQPRNDRNCSADARSPPQSRKPRQTIIARAP